MIARRSVWSDPAVKEWLPSFVTVADEVGRLQRGKDAECRTFQGFCESGHYGGRTEPTDTRQGIYVVTPRGRFLASINTHSAAKVAEMLRTSLARWAELPAAERALGEQEAKDLQASKRFEDRYPSDGLVLAEYLRDLGRPVDEKDWRTRAWNTDQVWFTAAEARSLVPKQHEVGAVIAVPPRLVERLARFHLLDSVRGQTPPMSRDAVREASLQSQVTAVQGDEVSLQFTGKTRTEVSVPAANAEAAKETSRGVATDLRGHARWNAKTGRFTAFELLAVGTRWGATQYNQRAQDLEPT
ncbi:MAG TPA: hypothetical protein VF384_09520, partial [Planctomycetota bacterium]